VERGEIEWEDYSNFAMVSRFTAGAMGLPFMPTRSLLGSDVLAKDSLSPEQRAADPRTASKKAHVMASPFDPDDQVVLLPAIHTDFTVLHVQKATPSGVIRIEGQTFADFEQALCADVLIVTAEEIVPEETLRLEAERNRVPYFAVHHVCHVPFGAHPFAVYRYYDYDPWQLKRYHAAAANDAAFQEYLDTYVYSVPDHASYLTAIGGPARLSALQADPILGYSPTMPRRRLD
jgi:glutaconate CoA-transferase subunit A